MNGKGAGRPSIRVCRLQDAEGVLELWRQAGATPGVTDTAESCGEPLPKAPPSYSWPRPGAGWVGSIIGTFDGWRGNIYRLAVHPDCRRRGIARALVADVEKMLAERGTKRITALVEKDHPWAMAF